MSNFYKLLKEKFPRKEDIVTEMINLEAICQLPKGTEYFISDLHGNTMLLIISYGQVQGLLELNY